MRFAPFRFTELEGFYRYKIDYICSGRTRRSGDRP
jgi:hypothetical protein